MRMATMIGAPMNSAAANHHPIRTTRTTLSSITRLVEAISNAMAAVKSAPLRNKERASATAAYEHDDDAAPSASARRIDFGRSSGRSGLISSGEHTPAPHAESVKPRISGQRI